MITGRSTINQASLTGEAAPVEVAEGDLVYAGTTNLTGGIDIRVTQVGQETTIGKVTQLIRQAEQSRTPRQLLIEQVSAFFVPVVISVAAVVWFLMSQSADQAVRDDAGRTAVTVLVIACPSVLLLASPNPAMLAAFAAAARLGILIKQPSYLEASANADAIIFDKTGTITTGKFQVTKLCRPRGSRPTCSGPRRTASSNHPLAQLIVATARAARIEPDGSNDYQEVHGRGVRRDGRVKGVHWPRFSWLVGAEPVDPLGA